MSNDIYSILNSFKDMSKLEFLETLLDAGKKAEIANPAVNIHKNSERYVFLLAAMGVKPEDVKVDVRNNDNGDSGRHLHVEAVIKDPFSDQEYAYKELDMNYQLHRCIDIPSDADVENASSTLEYGVLTITIPRIVKEASSPAAVKVIPVASRG